MRADADNAYGYSPSYPMATRFVPASDPRGEMGARARGRARAGEEDE